MSSSSSSTVFPSVDPHRFKKVVNPRWNVNAKCGTCVDKLEKKMKIVCIKPYRYLTYQDH